MGIHERQSYLQAIRTRYRKATRAEKGLILDEFCAVCGYQRKYAIRLLRARRKQQRPLRKAGPKREYDSQVLLPHLTAIWLATDQMCSKKLKAALPEWVAHYQFTDEQPAAFIRQKLLSMSAATIDRLLKPIRIKHKRRGLCGTKPGRLLKNQIPIKTDHWDVTQPGFLEADTVAHCGNSLIGDFIWSLNMTDILTAWTECRATWNKGAAGVCEQIHAIEKALPFPLLGFDCDNGSEFLNHHLVRYFSERPSRKTVQFTRSRPYKKNDNAHVEQKNWTHIRHLFGYDRLDNPVLVHLMNDLYANEWSLYQNHFCPTMKLIEKVKINSKYRKRYDSPQTPYQRLLVSGQLTKRQTASLKTIHNSLNPFDLKHRIEEKLQAIFRLVSVSSNVRQRL